MSASRSCAAMTSSWSTRSRMYVSKSSSRNWIAPSATLTPGASPAANAATAASSTSSAAASVPVLTGRESASISASHRWPPASAPLTCRADCNRSSNTGSGVRAHFSSSDGISSAVRVGLLQRVELRPGIPGGAVMELGSVLRQRRPGGTGAGAPRTSPRRTGPARPSLPGAAPSEGTRWLRAVRTTATLSGSGSRTRPRRKPRSPRSVAATAALSAASTATTSTAPGSSVSAARSSVRPNNRHRSASCWGGWTSSGVPQRWASSLITWIANRCGVCRSSPDER